MRTMHAFPDIRDWEIIKERRGMRQLRSALIDTPLVGDWIVLADGEGVRVGRTFDGGLQAAPLDGSAYYLTPSGELEHSGPLSPPVTLDRISDTGQTRNANAWIFHHDVMRASNGVTFPLSVRVWMTT